MRLPRMLTVPMKSGTALFHAKFSVDQISALMPHSIDESRSVLVFNGANYVIELPLDALTERYDNARDPDPFE